MPKHHRIHILFGIALLVGLVVSPTTRVYAESSDPGSHTRVSLGIQFGPPESCQRPPSPLNPSGVCVLGVRPGGAAERAGIMAGDILQRLGTAGVETASDLLGAASSLKLGDRPNAVVWRKESQLDVTLEIEDQDLATSAANQSAVIAPSLPQLPYRIKSPPADAKPLLSKVSDIDTAVWLEPDLLNIVHRDKREGVMIGGTLQLPMIRIPGTDVWVLQLVMKGWERSFFNYNFVAPGPTNNGPPRAQTFRGQDAIGLPEILENLQGRMYERTLRSRFLSEDRRVSVYIPPASKRRGLRVLFMADGQATADFARAIEPLVVSGRVAPFAIVGIHALPSRVPVGAAFDVSRDRRSQEYLLGIAPDAYAKHMKFFIEEVVPWASSEYGLSSARDDRAIFGFSSGAAFAAAAALQHPEVFGNALPFSIGFPQLPERPKSALPHFYFVAGELEPAFLAGTRTVREIVAGWGADANLNVYMSGHDQLMWQVGLVESIPRVFPGQSR